MLQSLSKYEFIDIDNEKEVYCFATVLVGLKRHKDFTIDPSKYPYTMKDFREFLRSAYYLKRSWATKLRDGETRRARLLLVSRKKTWVFTSVDGISSMARSQGFEVVVAEANVSVAEFAGLVNSCDVLMGVHGAGLKNAVFLPQNAIVIQVVPLGNMEWLSRAYFGDPSKDMNLSYLDYDIDIKESTLVEQFPTDHAVLKDPYELHKGDWNAFREIYLDKQNVKLDVNSFRPTLLKALKLLHE